RRSFPSRQVDFPSHKEGPRRVAGPFDAAVSVATCEVADEAEQFDVDPDQAQREAEGALPGELLRRALLDALLDRVEVEEQEEAAEQDHRDAEDDGQRAAV